MCCEIRIIWNESVWWTLAFIVRMQAEKESRGGAYNTYWVPGKCQEIYYALCIWNLASSAQFSSIVTIVLIFGTGISGNLSNMASFIQVPWEVKSRNTGLENPDSWLYHVSKVIIKPWQKSVEVTQYSTELNASLLQNGKLNDSKILIGSDFFQFRLNPFSYYFC